MTVTILVSITIVLTVTIHHQMVTKIVTNADLWHDDGKQRHKQYWYIKLHKHSLHEDEQDSTPKRIFVAVYLKNGGWFQLESTPFRAKPSKP